MQVTAFGSEALMDLPKRNAAVAQTHEFQRF